MTCINNTFNRSSFTSSKFNPVRKNVLQKNNGVDQLLIKNKGDKISFEGKRLVSSLIGLLGLFLTGCTYVTVQNFGDIKPNIILGENINHTDNQIQDFQNTQEVASLVEDINKLNLKQLPVSVNGIEALMSFQEDGSIKMESISPKGKATIIINRDGTTNCKENTTKISSEILTKIIIRILEQIKMH